MKTNSALRLKLLLSATTVIASLATGSAFAQTAPQEEPAAATAPEASQEQPAAQSEDRLVPLSGGTIRPFAGGILPYAGTIRTFAGTISGSAGTIRSFQGDTTASAGTIRSFAGTIRSFAGTIRSFQGSMLTPTGPDATFWGGLYPAAGSLTASAGTIRSFSGDFEAMAGTIRSFAGTIRSFDGPLLSWDQGAQQYQGLDTSIANLVAASKATWGAAVTAQTGKTFEAGFSDRMLAKYGIDLNNAQSLVGMDEVGVEMFMMDWYDNLMNYSGSDQVDHWMSEINWTPRVTQDLGSGKDSKIGLLDFTVTGDGVSSLVKASGVSTVAGIHGSAVLSLMTAAHDGKGVMGIAPGASVWSYNPFDESYTAGWADIKAGVINLVKNGATIVNMSLGVPGWTLNGGWNSVFSDSAVSSDARKRVFVLAAGNDGITQTQDVQWAFDKNPAIIVVGSVDPNGKISDFSNRPGTVCLTQDGKMAKDGTCTGGGRSLLMNNFIVAPGEFILVSDGQGGVTRMSGTSFAAPLVSGTVALIHDRWPWFRDKPADTATIILGSAKDLGAPGVDPVYGRGELDVTAALSPKSLDLLSYKVSVNGGSLQDVKAATLTSDQRESMISFWEANKAYITAFENTPTSYRDFSIALSSKLAGQTVGNSAEQFNSYLTSRFYDWFRNGGGSAPVKKLASLAFSDTISTGPVQSFGGMVATMNMTPRTYTYGLRNSNVPFDTGMTFASPDGRFGFAFGSGRSGPALGQAGFAMQSDYEVAGGGANPFLGFASGAGYASAQVRLASNLTLSSGISRQDAKRDWKLYGAQDRMMLARIAPYQAAASTMQLAYRAAPWLTTTVGYTLLSEQSGLLGMQSVDSNDLAHGSQSDAATAGVAVDLSDTLSIAGTATVGRTRSTDVSRQAIAVGSGGLISSAYQAAITKVGLIGNDRLRLTFAQPLHLEHGGIDVANVQVIDRQTGELGEVVQHFDLQGIRRRYVAEMLYGRPVLGNRAEVHLFGRMNIHGDEAAGQAALTMGTSFRLSL